MDAPIAPGPAITPGPAISGVASGNTDTSRLAAASAHSSAVVVVPSDERANTMSRAINITSTPPAVRSAGRVIPKGASTLSPNSAKNRGTRPPSRQPLGAMARRSRAVFCGVRAGKRAAVSSGPTFTMKVVNEECGLEHGVAQRIGPQRVDDDAVIH